MATTASLAAVVQFPIQAEQRSVVAHCVIQCSRVHLRWTRQLCREREREGRVGERGSETTERGAEIWAERKSVRASLTAVVAIYSQALLHSPEMLSHLPHIDRQISLRTHTKILTCWNTASAEKDRLCTLHIRLSRTKRMHEWMKGRAQGYLFGNQGQFLLHQELCNNSSCLSERV